jgi:hypothetical protein
MKRILLLFCLFFLFSCERKASPEVSFYFWKTNFKLTALEKQTLEDNEVKKIYLRYFDVALTNKKPFPVAPVSIYEKLKNVKIIPVVFIKNEVFLSKETNVKELSQNVLGLIDQINQKNGITVDEIQIDCDWSIESQQPYFDFIENIKSKTRDKISATIRLHQVKYSNETKIPKVDKGVLMMYNMGKIAPDDKNSIYDDEIASQYVESLKKYPLELNVALPIFSWAIQIRNNKVINLISKVNNSNFTEDKNFKNIRKNFFKTQQNTLKMGLYFKKDDVIKIESVSEEDLKKMMHQLNQNLEKQPKEVIYYDLDEINIKQFDDDKSFFKKCNSWF